MKNIEDYKGKKYVIQCKTQGEWDYITKLLGYKWNSFNSRWSDAKENSIIYCEYMCQGNVITNKYKTNHNCELLQAKDFMEEEIKYTLEYCKANKIAVKISDIESANKIKNLVPGIHENNWINWIDRYPTINKYSVVFDSYQLDLFLHTTEYCEMNKYTFISAEQFIKDNTKETMQKLTVKKSEFKKVHNVACPTWQTKCKEYASKDLFSDVITFTQQQVDEMFDAAQSHQLPILEEVFGKREEKFNSSFLKIGEIIQINDPDVKEYNGKYLIKTFDNLTMIENPNKTWSKNCGILGKKLPKGTKIEIIAG